MPAINEARFRWSFCDIFIQHVIAPFQNWSSLSEEYRTANIGVTFATCLVVWEMPDGK
jgi:3-methyladenine DNA glycosylase AlkD